VNLFDKCRKFDRAEEAHARGLLPYFHAISRTDHGTEVTMEGRNVCAQMRMMRTTSLRTMV